MNLGLEVYEPRSKSGRPSKFCAEIAVSIVENLRLGNYIEHAAASAGITKSTLYAWMEKGRKEQERIEAGFEPNEENLEFLDFSYAVEQARAEAVSRNVSVIQKAAIGGSWQAAAWWLERTQPQLFGRKQHLEHSGAGERPIKLEISTQDIEDKVRILLLSRQD